MLNPKRFFGQRFTQLLIALAMVGGLLGSGFLNAPTPAAADGDTGTIIVTGVVVARLPDLIVVSAMTFKLTPATVIDPLIVVGDTVQVTGIVNPDGTLVAQVVTRLVAGVTATPLSPPTLTPIPLGTLTSTPIPTATPLVLPTLTPIMSATPSAASPTTTPIGTALPYPYVIIVIEGPIQTIDITINMIVVYGYEIKLRDDDRRLQLKKGDWVRVRGKGQPEGGRIVIVVITIVIINTPVIIIDSGRGGGDNGTRPRDDRGGRGGDDNDDDDDDDDD